MLGWFFLGLSTFLLLCALVIPLLLMSNKVRHRHSAPWNYGSTTIDQAMLITLLLGIPGVPLAFLSILLVILEGGDSIQPRLGWIFISLGSFFLICTVVVPVSWATLTSKLNPSAELGGIGGCLYTIAIAIILGLLSITLLILGIRILL